MVNYLEVYNRAKELEKRYNLNYQNLLQRFMLERVLERISISKYKDNFILKGGLLLSALFGIDNRVTKDMDTTIKGINISKEIMTDILNEILSIDLKDGVSFDVVDITNIMEEDEYGGNKYHIVGKLQGRKINLEVDISTGDKITPKELKYKYHLIFENRSILINSYNIETILSEKIETILKRGKFNSRMKDFYDVYYFLVNFKKEIDKSILNSAIKNTFSKRKSLECLKEYNQIIKSIEESERIQKSWNKYKQVHQYAKDIEISEILILLRNYISTLNIVEITVH